MAHPRIIVIGSGIIGSAIAYHLAKAGARPLVLEAGEAGGIATHASFAWINASWGNPEPYFRLRMRSIAEWHRLQEELPALPVTWCGSLTYDTTPDETEAYVEQHRAWGYRIRLIGPARIRSREAALREVPDAAALCEDEGAVEPAEAAAILMQAAIGSGADVRTGVPVSGIEIADGRVTGVRASGTVLAADAVVVAAGTAAPELLRPAGYELPFAPSAGPMVHTEPVPPVLQGILVTSELELRQTRAGQLIAAFDARNALPGGIDETAKRLMDRIGSMLALERPPVLSRTTVGLRPIPGDGFPVVGAIPGVEGLFAAAMHSGITLAPVVGLALADEILAGRSEPLLAPYRPRRFVRPVGSAAR